MLTDPDGRLYKDGVLVREDSAYARLDDSVLSRFTLTSQLQYPVPTYSGKNAVIFDLVGRAPYLVAGDSPGDLPMMALGRHRLWIARQNKPGYQKTAAAWFRKTGAGRWLVRSVDARPGGGFVA